MEILGFSKEERHQIILKQLSKKNYIKVKDLAEKLNVSMETVRQDLSFLEEELKLKKVHGGATRMKEQGLELYFSKRIQHNRKIKIAMAAAASDLIESGETIGIGSGTTALHIVEHLKGKEMLTVITSSIPVLNQLVELKAENEFHGEVYFIGGKVNSELLSTSGSLTEKMLKDIYLDKFFFSCDGFTEEGIFAHNSNEGLLSQLYLKHAARSVLLADSSKLNQKNFIKITNFSRIDTIITDSKCSKKYEEVVLESGIEWISIEK